MFQKITKAIVVLSAIIVVIYLLHQFIFSILNINDAVFKYSLFQLYVFFGCFSITIEIVLLVIKQKNIDLVGNVFLILTLIKMMFCFVLGNSILNQTNSTTITQKNNFLALFFMFLMIETVSTIKMLNSKEI